MSKTATARFWVYLNRSNVKISLSYGQTSSWVLSEPTDEGYRSVGIRFSHKGDHVVMTEYWRGSDCDGYHEDYRIQMCTIDDLQAIPARTVRDRLIPPKGNWLSPFAFVNGITYQANKRTAELR